MITIFLLLKLAALFSFILIPLITRKKPVKVTAVSSFAINEYGYLELTGDGSNKQPQIN